MKKKIAILGSTGSIGTSLLKLIHKDKKTFTIQLLSANKNYKKLLRQAKIFDVKNLIITDINSFNKLKIKTKELNINVFNNFDSLNKIFKNKIDYVMSSIIGLEGLNPTIKIIKHTKNIAIANKESIICGWSLLNFQLKKNNTNFIPVDSEHFSIWYGLQNIPLNKVEKFYLTASGGPLLNYPINKFHKVSVTQTLKHPNWKMGKKISVDSATMMNKIFEIIEANKIFNIPYAKLSILIEPSSYIHAILKFNNGMIKIIAHDTTMVVPIFNTLYLNKNKILKTKKININKLNNLDLKLLNHNKFPVINILKKLKNNTTMFETVIVSANDQLVNLFLKKKIKYLDISRLLLKVINMKEFKKYNSIKPKAVKSILDLSKYVRLKINSMCV